jgi:hypothetical protein
MNILIFLEPIAAKDDAIARFIIKKKLGSG